MTELLNARAGVEVLSPNLKEACLDHLVRTVRGVAEGSGEQGYSVLPTIIFDESTDVASILTVGYNDKYADRIVSNSQKNALILHRVGYNGDTLEFAQRYSVKDGEGELVGWGVRKVVEGGRNTFHSGWTLDSSELNQEIFDDCSVTSLLEEVTRTGLSAGALVRIDRQETQPKQVDDGRAVWNAREAQLLAGFWAAARETLPTSRSLNGMVELAIREGGGMVVQLCLIDGEEAEVSYHPIDAESELPWGNFKVDKSNALEAFYHPFAAGAKFADADDLSRLARD